jgi:hypothetical protein
MSRSKATNSRRWLWLRRCSVHASRRGYCPSERPATFPRALGNGRSGLLVTGTGSHSLSGLGKVGSSALQLFLRFRSIPTPRSTDDADHRLPARIDEDVLDRDEQDWPNEAVKRQSFGIYPLLPSRASVRGGAIVGHGAAA